MKGKPGEGEIMNYETERLEEIAAEDGVEG
jgi:hypothetical protein